MTKGGLAKRLFFGLIWGIVAIVFMLVAFATFNGIAGATVEPIFGSSGLSIPHFAETWLDVLANNWIRGLFLAKGNEGFGAFLTMFTSLWDINAWTLGLNGIVFYCFAAALAIYVIFFFYYLIWGLFVYKKKKSMILNIFWSLIPLAIVLYLLVFLQGAVYGKDSYAGLQHGDLAKGYVMQLVYATCMGGAASAGAETKSIIKAWATFIVACLAVIFVIVSFVYCALYGFGVVAYLKRHKYDYLEKAERKKRQKYYKTHGFENVASKQQEPVYATPYPYSYQQPQVVLPPNGGNSVQTGNNAPLVVQYISTNGEDKKVKDDETSIYAAQRQAAPDQLTKEDIKDVVVAVLAENNLLASQQEEQEEGMSEAEFRNYVHEAIEEAKPAERPIPPLVVSVPEKIEKIKEAEKAPAQEPAPVEEKPAEEGITEDQLRALVAEEIANALSNLVVEEEPVKEEPKPVAKPAAKPAPVAQKPAPQPKPQPAPVQPKPKQVVPRGREQHFRNKVARESIENLSFNERLAKASPEIVEAYNSLKNLLASYGLKNRVSNSGDTFRLHKNTYVKITLGGSQLKVYFALNPADYANSAIPVGDASGKEIYKDVPLVFRVKSNLSLRRARDLVNDTMNKAGIAKAAEEGQVDYVAEVKKELKAQQRAAKKAAQK